MIHQAFWGICDKTRPVRGWLASILKAPFKMIKFLALLILYVVFIGPKWLVQKIIKVVCITEEAPFGLSDTESRIGRLLFKIFKRRFKSVKKAWTDQINVTVKF